MTPSPIESQFLDLYMNKLIYLHDLYLVNPLMRSLIDRRDHLARTWQQNDKNVPDDYRTTAVMKSSK